MLAAVQKSIARHFSPFISRTERVNNSAAGAEMGGGDDTHRFKSLPSRVINKLSLFPLTRMRAYGAKEMRKTPKSCIFKHLLE